MKYQKLSPQLYIANRSRLAAAINHGGIAVFTSNDIYPTSADGTMPFKQASDIFYLTGVDQEETILVIFPSASQAAHQEILFVKETSEHIAIWEEPSLQKSKPENKQEYSTYNGHMILIKPCAY